MDETLTPQPIPPTGTPETPIVENFTQVSAPEHKPRWLLLILMTSILVLVVSGGIFYYFHTEDSTQQNSIATSPSPTQQQVPTPSQTIVPAIVIKDTSRWKTYTNETLGISLKYPEELYDLKVNMVRQRAEIPGEQYESISLEPNDSFNAVQPLAVTYSISIAVVPNIYNYSLAKPKDLFGNGVLMSYIPELLGDTPIKPFTLGGSQALRVDGCCGGRFGVEADIQTVRDGNVIQILVEPRQAIGDENTNKDIYEDIISSITFLK